MADHTLAQVTEMAHQAEIVSKLIESYPHEFQMGEITAISALLAKLSGSVASWLIEEQARGV